MGTTIASYMVMLCVVRRCIYYGLPCCQSQGVHPKSEAFHSVNSFAVALIGT